MLRRHEISDSDWDRLKHLLPGQTGQHGGIAQDNRRFINAVLWIARTGAPWRDLPERLGNWNSQWRRFDRWAKKGRMKLIAEVLRDAELDVLMLVRPSSAPIPVRRERKKMGRVWRPRRSSAWSQPRRFRHQNPRQFQWFGATGWVDTDGWPGLGHIGQGETLLGEHEPEAVIADKGYDSDAFIAVIENRGSGGDPAQVQPRRGAWVWPAHIQGA
jgi:transposase